MIRLPNVRRRLTFSLIFLSIIFVVILFSLIYSSFVYYGSCNDEVCFFSHLRNCDRVLYTKTGDFNVFYRIIGYNFYGCQVIVSFDDSNGVIGMRDVYQNSSMDCTLNFGFDTYPESALPKCSGRLKEGLQEVLIGRLKVEIARNIGDINVDVLK